MHHRVRGCVVTSPRLPFSMRSAALAGGAVSMNRDQVAFAEAVVDAGERDLEVAEFAALVRGGAGRGR